MATPINKDAFLKLLPALGFVAQGTLWTKPIGTTHLTVDVKNEQLIYPEGDGLVVNERQTCNFSSPENFVVFECVHRLLEKGYRPEHIELEPKWKLGHGASGGRADILVKDNNEKALLIIECKTAGREFDRAWRDTLYDGGQLFGYVEQVRSTQFLCLYASFVEDGTLDYQSHIIAHRDNEKYLAENPTLKSFATAQDRKDRFGVWRDTYKQDYTTGGIFEENIQPYHIGKNKYTRADLHPISDSDRQKKYHQFATILRQHNVSGRENAFDKLVNLFLCKLVDETENPDDLKFYWKGVAYDTHFALLDRLQQLYHAGMGKFLGEEITYINESDVKQALRFIRQSPDATQRAVWKLFIQQKFFTNNDFSFIDVHNEKLFYQNAEVLLKVLQMWQDIRLIGDHQHNQFLGDMFEGFLDQGVKQSEGQYFTPMPICRFLLMSLPLESLVRDRTAPPQAIDYACGAGHFLTELALQLKPLVSRHHPQQLMENYHASIFGIEKEYRLSKIAKVSAFMYGQPDINICYGDALIAEHENYPAIANNNFDLLVANPPFSVRGFLETLPEKERGSYSLTETIDKFDTANSIETFFIERAKQLLKAGGIAAIILPSSILSNGGTTYVRAREILLGFFDIVAIAEFGSGTFGKTGTNTVTLFLRRKATNPDAAEHFRERVDEWFGPDAHQGIYQDGHLIDRYATHIGVAPDDYKTLLSGAPCDALLAHETFVQYQRAFDDSTEIKNLKKQKGFKAKSDAAQKAELDKRFLAFAQTIERDKLLYYVLASEQSNQVLILKTPQVKDDKDKSGKKKLKAFLGYSWSGTKGDEGIKLIKDAQGHHITPLYDETNRDNPNKLNHAIARNFEGTLSSVPAELATYLSLVPLHDLLDFSRVTFEKQIALTAKKSVAVQSKWPLERLGEIVDVLIGGTPSRANPAYFQGSNIWVSISEMSGQIITDSKEKITDDAVKDSNVKLIPKGTTLLSFKLSIGKTAVAGCDLYTNEAIAGLIPKKESEIIDSYLFQLFDAKHIALDSGFKAFGKSLNSTYLKEDIFIPVPDPDTQKAIVTECEAVDAEVEAAQEQIAQARTAIETIVNDVYAANIAQDAIANLSLDVQYGLSEKMNEAGIGYKIFRMNEIINGRMVDNGAMKYADITPEEFAKLKLNRGDVLFNRTNSIEHVGKTGLFDLEGDYCFASYLVRVVPNTQKVLPLFLTYMMNAEEFQTEAKSKASKSINQANINATIMKNMKIPVPSPTEQQAIVDNIQALEQQIADAQVILDGAPARKAAILQKYL